MSLAITGPRLLVRAANVTLSATSSQASRQCKDIDHCRTLQSIVYSCLSTIFLCTWAALHLNVPKVSSKVSPFRRVWFTLGALLAPELVFSFAFFEWVDGTEALKKILDRYPDCAWTETHILFACMGGFRLIREDGTKEQIYDQDFEKYVSDGTIDVPRISIEEIQERSKGDPVSKGIVVLQTAWFVIQCIHRSAQHLPVTELEITTLAHAVLNFLTYWCWWNKPLNIGLPIDVPAKKPSLGPDSDNTEHNVNSIGDQEEMERERAACDHSKPNTETNLVCVVDPKANRETNDTVTEENVLHVLSTADSAQLAEGSPVNEQEPSRSIQLPYGMSLDHVELSDMDAATPLIPGGLIVNSDDQADDGDGAYQQSNHDCGNIEKVTIPSDGDHHEGKAPENLTIDVESLKVHGHSLSLRVKLGVEIAARAGEGTIEKLSWSIILFLLASAFGAIHCLAWKSDFPTRAEQIIWQVSSMLVVIIGGGSFVCAIYAPSDMDGEAHCDLFTWGAVVFSLLYGCARASLLLLALLALRSLPYEAYVSPSWPSFVPHIH